MEIDQTTISLLKETQETNIKDISAFDVRAKLTTETFYKRPSYDQLAKVFVEFLSPNFGLMTRPWIIGVKGSGKTTTVNYILDQCALIPELKFNSTYLNCSGLDTSYKVLRRLLGDQKGGVEFFELLNKFKTKYGATTKTKQIVVFDELDSISDGWLFYHLSRDDELSNVFPVAITRTIKMFKMMPEDVISSWQPKEFFFDTYNINELFNILLKRAEKGLYSYNQAMVLKIAAATHYKADSDTRVGMELLKTVFLKRGSFQLNEGEDVSDEIFNTLCNKAERQYYLLKEPVIRCLSENKLVVLYFCLEHYNSIDSYKEHVHNSSVRLSKNHFLKLAMDLVNIDLLSIMKGGRGRSNPHYYNELIGPENIKLVKSLIESRKIIIKNGQK